MTEGKKIPIRQVGPHECIFNRGSGDGIIITNVSRQLPRAEMEFTIGHLQFSR